MKSIPVPDVETWKYKLKILEFSFILVFPLYYNMLYRYNAKYLQFDWLKQRAYFWYF